MTPAFVVAAATRAFAIQTAVVRAGMTTRQIPTDDPVTDAADDEAVAAVPAGDALVLTDADLEREPNGDTRIQLDTGTTVVAERDDYVDLEDMQ